MTQKEAFILACERFGDGATVGYNAQSKSPRHVGAKGAFDRWRIYGEGETFEEAFAAAAPSTAVIPKIEREAIEHMEKNRFRKPVTK